jgi:hypothetical protein
VIGADQTVRRSCTAPFQRQSQAPQDELACCVEPVRTLPQFRWRTMLQAQNEIARGYFDQAGQQNQ